MKVPFIVIHGRKDPMVDPKGTELLMHVAASKDKTAWYLDEAWHALLAEPEHQEVCDRLVSWISERVVGGEQEGVQPQPSVTAGAQQG
jgi:alpha-beta hydrolase superfamily lysophospholipase